MPGRSEDDLLKPMHLNFKWFGFESLPTFMAYDVMKNPEIENDFIRFENHLKALRKINVFALGLHFGLKQLQDGPRWSQDGPTWLQVGPRWPQDGL